MFVHERMSQKDVAAVLKVSAVSISTWCKEGGWKQERDTRLNSDASRIENIQAIIDYLAEQKLKLIQAIEAAQTAGNAQLTIELRTQSDSLGDEVSKWNKSLQSLQTEDKRRITLAIYIYVMDKIFKHIQEYDPELYRSSLDFQEAHIAAITKEFGL